MTFLLNSLVQLNYLLTSLFSVAENFNETTSNLNKALENINKWAHRRTQHKKMKFSIMDLFSKCDQIHRNRNLKLFRYHGAKYRFEKIQKTFWREYKPLRSP